MVSPAELLFWRFRHSDAVVAIAFCCDYGRGTFSCVREKKRDSFEASNRMGVAVVIAAWGGMPRIGPYLSA
jgi:hypothetical protein